MLSLGKRRVVPSPRPFCKTPRTVAEESGKSPKTENYISISHIKVSDLFNMVEKTAKRYDLYNTVEKDSQGLMLSSVVCPQTRPVLLSTITARCSDITKLLQTLHVQPSTSPSVNLWDLLGTAPARELCGSICSVEEKQNLLFVISCVMCQNILPTTERFSMFSSFYLGVPFPPLIPAPLQTEA